MVTRMVDESNTKSQHQERINLFKEENQEIINTCLNEKITEEQELTFQKKYKNQAKELKSIANEIFESNGMKSIYSNNLISSFYLDILTICQHKLLQEDRT